MGYRVGIDWGGVRHAVCVVDEAHGTIAARLVGSIAKCEAPIFPSVCTSEAPLARAYRQHDLDQRPGHLRRLADRLDGTL